MSSNLQRYKDDLEALVRDGAQLAMAAFAGFRPDEFADACASKGTDPEALRWSLPSFRAAYQPRHLESCAVIRQPLPHRLEGFTRGYARAKTRKTISPDNYAIEDCLQVAIATRADGVRLAGPDVAIPPIDLQRRILEPVCRRLEGSLLDIRQLVQADVFDSEIEASRELARKGFLRAVGALAGVVIERHLAGVAAHRGPKPSKAHPPIADWNDLLKDGEVMDVPVWRCTQRLGDVRNPCCHNKRREPTAAEVDEPLTGAEKLMKTLY